MSLVRVQINCFSLLDVVKLQEHIGSIGCCDQLQLRTKKVEMMIDEYFLFYFFIPLLNSNTRDSAGDFDIHYTESLINSRVISAHLLPITKKRWENDEYRF